MADAISHQRREQLHLALRFQHRFVGAVQVVEMADQRVDAWLHIKRLKHMAADKIGQVAHRFHRHRLVKQIQRLLVLDTEAAAKPGTIRRKGFEYLGLDSCAAQLLSECGDIGAEVGEIGGDGKAAFGTDKKTCRLSLRVLYPEHLCQRHGLVKACVVKYAQNHRVIIVVPQRHRFGGAASVVALRLVMSQHVGSKRAFPVVRTGRFVVRNLVGRHEQRGHRIDKR